MTDALQDVLRGVATLGELSGRTTDMILSTGELLSSAIVSAALQVRGIRSVLVDSRQCIVTDSTHTRAVPMFEQTADRLRREVEPLVRANQVRGDGWLHCGERGRRYYHARSRRV